MGKSAPDGAILLVGDSFSQDFYNIIRATDLLDEIKLHRHFIHNQCQPVLAERRTPQVIAAQGKANCTDAAVTRNEIQQMAMYDAVILVANWKDWSISESILVAQAIEDLNGRVIVIGKKRFARGGLRPYAGRPLEEIKAMRTPKSQNIADMDQLLRETFGDDQFLSIMDVICDGTDDKACSMATVDGTPISYDGGHLTPGGATYLAELMGPKLKAMLFNYQE